MADAFASRSTYTRAHSRPCPTSSGVRQWAISCRAMRFVQLSGPKAICPEPHASAEPFPLRGLYVTRIRERPHLLTTHALAQTCSTKRSSSRKVAKGLVRSAPSTRSALYALRRWLSGTFRVCHARPAPKQRGQPLRS